MSRDKGEDQQDGRRGKITFRIKPHTCQRHSEGSSKTLCSSGDATESEPDLPLSVSVSCRGTGQQWPAPMAGALSAVDLGMAQALLEEVAINSTIELPELTQDWEIDSWKAQTELCAHKDPGEMSSDPTKD